MWNWRSYNMNTGFMYAVCLALAMIWPGQSVGFKLGDYQELVLVGILMLLWELCAIRRALKSKTQED
jgi:hypothetical protein